MATLADVPSLLHDAGADVVLRSPRAATALVERWRESLNVAD